MCTGIACRILFDGPTTNRLKLRNSLPSWAFGQCLQMPARPIKIHAGRQILDVLIAGNPEKLRA
jgi:hypothetical protein